MTLGLPINQQRIQGQAETKVPKKIANLSSDDSSGHRFVGNNPNLGTHHQ
jgi:hypothetical protein